MPEDSDSRQVSRRAFLSGVVASGVLARSGFTESARGRNGGQSDRLEVVSEHEIRGAKEVVLQGGFAYVAVTGTQPGEGDTVRPLGGLAVVDLRNPVEPETVALAELPYDEIPTPNTPDSKVSGDLAGLANDNSFPGPGGVAFFDVSDPTAPEQVSFYNAATTVHNHFIDGDYAYLCESEHRWLDRNGDAEIDHARLNGDAGVEILDVSEPRKPARVGFWRLRDDYPAFADAGINNHHDVYVQDGLAYQCYWDAGVVVLDVSDPSDPEPVSQFGAAPKGDEPIPPVDLSGNTSQYFQEVYPRNRQQTPPGNAHYVQPSPDGRHVYVGAETFRKRPGGIDVWDLSDLENPERVARIDPPAATQGGGGQPEEGDQEGGRNLGLRTSHNFDVTEDRLYSSWYGGGVRVFDVSDPADPVEIGAYDSEDTSFWTAVEGNGVVVASDIDRGLFVFEDP
jgi:hypothetical protein